MKHLLAAFAFTLAAPLPLAAQDLVFDTSALDACFEEGGWTECVGEAAAACMEASDNGESTIVMTGCLDAEWQYWDRDLNESYARLMTEAQGADSATYEEQRPSEAEALRDMQRAWIAFRDATCHYESMAMWGGTGQNLLWTDCFMRLTGEQALYLHSHLSGA